MPRPDPIFPPLLRGLAVDAGQSPLDAALSGIAQGALGAGDVVWSRDTARAAMAVVMEPEVHRRRASEMLYLVMVGLGDALGALAPAELGISYLWPGTIRAQGARVGEVRLVMGPDGSDGAPRFLVVDLALTLRRGLSDVEPGHDVAHTSLEEEGCADLDRAALIEAIARHVLVWLHRWSEDGFAPVQDAWLFRADHYRGPIAIEHGGALVRGVFAGLDEHGGLLLKTDAGAVLLDTLESVAMASGTAENKEQR